MPSENVDAQVARNVAIHDRIARQYERLHGEIFNDLEQARLHASLSLARDEIRTGRSPPKAFDFGCGSGNLTNHLLELGFRVTAADVSKGFLDLVQNRHTKDRLDVHLMNGRNLDGVASESFDLIATYSVLHHVPDYLEALVEMARICSPGGVIFIDHEASECFWTADPVYREFQKKALRHDWRKYLRLSNYLHKLRSLLDPRYTNEGDIHVWPDDHIEWPKIVSLLAGHSVHSVVSQDYLLYRNLYRRPVYLQYADQCADMRMMIFRKDVRV